ncbi:MAG: VWA domain-containing protein [Desulfosalsimonas sp.]
MICFQAIRATLSERDKGAVLKVKWSVPFLCALFLLGHVLFLGCAGGGGGDDSSGSEDSSSGGSPFIYVTPADNYNFGDVTPENSPVPLEVVIGNDGSAVLNVDDIILTANGANTSDPFFMDLSGGSDPFHNLPAEIAPGDKRTLEISFEPSDSASDGSYDGTLTIISNYSVFPEWDVSLIGTKAQISKLYVRINQIEASCPREAGDLVEVYVSVIDQGGYPVSGLETNNFSITEGVSEQDPEGASFVSEEGYVPISVALAMDYSDSITSIEDAVQNMEISVKSFIDQMKADDEAEIIKFADQPEVIEPFTSDKDALTAAVDAAWDGGRGTSLYDAVLLAIQDTSEQQNVRKAVIVITDGENTISGSTLQQVIDLGSEKDIPVFAAGVGDEINVKDLEKMTKDTGGQFYEAEITDNLKNTYQQLADVLYENQYILTYHTDLTGADSADLTVGVNYNDIKEGDIEHTKEIASCP